jgi:4-hydroxy-2-oxoglutarate aldolase
VTPEECIRLQTAFNQGKLAQANEFQGRLTPLAAAVTTKHGIGGLKMAMDLAGYFGGEPRLPLKRPGTEVEKEIKGLLTQLTSL